jgi:hypothetical protein
MADPTPLTVIQLSSGYPAAGDAVVYTAMDATNGNSFKATGKETILVKNTSADTGRTLGMVSAPDRLGRTGDFSQLIGFGAEVALRPGVKGWRLADGTIKLTATTNDLHVAVLRDPV